MRHIIIIHRLGMRHAIIQTGNETYNNTETGNETQTTHLDILGLSLILMCGRTLGYSREQITFMEATELRAFK